MRAQAPADAGGALHASGGGGQLARSVGDVAGESAHLLGQASTQLHSRSPGRIHAAKRLERLRQIHVGTSGWTKADPVSDS